MEVDCTRVQTHLHPPMEAQAKESKTKEKGSMVKGETNIEEVASS